MAKRLILFSLRLFMLYVVAIILSTFFLGINSEVAIVCIEVVITLILWAFVWNDGVNKGYDHVRKDKNLQKSMEIEKPGSSLDKQYVPWFGFAAGALSQLPALLVLGAYLILDNHMQTGWYYALNAVYIYFTMIAKMLSGIYPLTYVLISLVFIAAAGLGYMNGPAKQKKIETIIERNKSKTAKRVQDEIKNKQQKKGAAKRPDGRKG